MFDIDDIARLRKQLGLTQAELSELSGINQSLINRLESKQIEPSYSKVKILIETLQKQERRKSRTCGDIASKSVYKIQSKSTLKEAARIIQKKNVSQLPVFDGEEVIGSLSEKTILRVLSESGSSEKAFKKIIENVMEPSFPTVNKNTPIELLYQILEFFDAVIVMNKAKIIGIITRSDLFKLK